MKKFLKKTVVSLMLSGALLFSLPALPAWALTGTYYTIDLNTAVPKVMTANGAINQTQSLAGMAEANGAFAAINGTYFQAYDNSLPPLPYGTVIRDGKVLHVGGGAVMGITADGKFMVDRLSISFECYVNGEKKCTPWSINHENADSGAVVLYTSEYAGTISPLSGAKAVIVGSSGKAEQIAYAPFNIPAGGFAIMYNSGVANHPISDIKLGDTVSYKPVYQTTFTNAADWENVQQALGAGPSLIINGVITADPAAENFTEAKISNSNPRSFIGSTASGAIIIGKTSSGTPREVAEYCQSLGMVNAICMDGAGSINLYYEGKNIATGRNINNGLGFIKQAEKPISVFVNGNQLSFTQAPFVADGTTLVPMRAIFEALDASVDFDAANQKITATSGNTVIELVIGQKTAMKNGQTINLDVAADTRNGSTMVPLRFVAEALQANVEWDGNTRTITITIN